MRSTYIIVTKNLKREEDLGHLGATSSANNNNNNNNNNNRPIKFYLMPIDVYHVTNVSTAIF
jgi:hypothetical protein